MATRALAKELLGVRKLSRVFGARIGNRIIEPKRLKVKQRKVLQDPVDELGSPRKVTRKTAIRMQVARNRKHS